MTAYLALPIIHALIAIFQLKTFKYIIAVMI